MKNFFYILYVFVFSVFYLYTQHHKDNCKIELPFSNEWAIKHYKKKEKNDVSRLAVIINHFGIHNSRSRKILNIIPDYFGLALSPYKFPSKGIMKIIEKQKHSLFYLQPITPYRDTFNHQDPYRMNADYDEKTNEAIALKTMLLISKNMKGVVIDEASAFLKDETSLKILLNHLKEKNLPLISSEMPFDHECRKICEKNNVILFEADYFIPRHMNREDVHKILSKLQDFLSKANFALLVIEEDIKNIEIVIDWIQSLSDDKHVKLVSFEDIINDKNIS
jgi:polysaccharide deacetylase 2 family uncharacterized protein YibQ